MMLLRRRHKNENLVKEKDEIKNTENKSESSSRQKKKVNRNGGKSKQR